MGERSPFPCHAIQVGGAMQRRPERFNVAVTKVVAVDDDEIRLARLGCRCSAEQLEHRERRHDPTNKPTHQLSSWRVWNISSREATIFVVASFST